MSSIASFIERLDACPNGFKGWKAFEDICIEILTYLFVPPLTAPKIQSRSYSGIDRRDAVFPNRNLTVDTNWGHIYQELNARMILFEFKNFEKEEIGKEEVDQARNYLTKPMGKLAILCCSKLPNPAAHIRRNSVYTADGKVILFLTKDQLKEMLFIKERGEDPSDLILDLVEWFYLQHE